MFARHQAVAIISIEGQFFDIKQWGDKNCIQNRSFFSKIVASIFSCFMFYSLNSERGIDKFVKERERKTKIIDTALYCGWVLNIMSYKVSGEAFQGII